MAEENNIELENDKQDSIEVSKTATGKYSWKIKKYFNWDKEKPEEVIEQIKTVDEEMYLKFK